MVKRFSPADRARAVRRALSGEVSKRQVAREVGVSETTLYRWIEAADEPSGKVAHLRVARGPDGFTSEEDGAPARTIAAAAEAGDYRATLVQLRNRLAKQLDDVNTPPRDMAALSRRFLEVVRELQALDLSDGDDDIGQAVATPDDEWDESAI